MTKSKTLSNSFSTGGGGFHFEAHVQASFVALMLTSGHAPCLPCWPIVEIKLQGKIDGFDTDDLVVTVENVTSKERRKLLGQVKHSIAITQGSTLFGEVMQSAWNDFKNPKVFTRDKDIIALITGPLNATDAHNVQWLLNQARHTKDVDEFFRNVQQANFSPPKSTKKLEVIQHHLKAANGDNDVSRAELYDFLNHFHLLNYDLGNEFGVVLPLLHSHISQFQRNHPDWLWSYIVDIVHFWNQDAGTITLGNLPDALLDTFKQKAMAEMPDEFKAAQEKPKTDWNQHSDATYLALAILIGSWQDNSQCDLEVITQLQDIGYGEWLKKAREILQCPGCPLSLKNGTWKVVNRAELWSLLGSRILDQNLKMFKSLAVSVLKELDPAFELPGEERYTANIHGKVLKYSYVLRKGIAEGLAILGNQPESCANCSQGNAEATCREVIDELLTDADWALWCNLDRLLPTLAEAAPDSFLNAVEKAMKQTPCPFDELSSQEGNGIHRDNYLTGLLWALETLAWEEKYLVRVCIILGELASHDPGGPWSNRPANSLSTILLPWLPQTLASVEKRKTAMKTLINEWPDIAWNLIIQLLPGNLQTSFGSHKPSWRKTIPDDWGKEATHQEYRQQGAFYAELAVTAAGQDPARLSTLIDHFDNLFAPAFDQLLQTLASQPILELPEEQQLLIWDHLTKFTNKHRRFSSAEWALPDEMITRIEQVAEQLAPTDPFNLYQHLFTDQDVDLYEENGDWNNQMKKITTRRENAISEVFQQKGIEGVIRFAESVPSPRQVGHALGGLDNDVFKETFLPDFLNTKDANRNALVSSFIQRRFSEKNWDWCDNIDKSNWSSTQIGHFLACLPFTKETWHHASEWLQNHEDEYWTRTGVNAYLDSRDLPTAIEKLIEYGRPNAAINCLYGMLYTNQPIDANQCVQALIAAVPSNKSGDAMDAYHIVELIKLLQTTTSVNEDDLFTIECTHLRLLDSHWNAEPKLLENRLANTPEFFCELIQLIYRSKKENQASKEPTEESKAIAKNVYWLLYKWKTPPGTQKDGTFNEERFTEWLQRVKKVCEESGHLEVALTYIGKVLIHTPPDPDGLWIHRAVAAALNNREADAMRDGYRTGTYNSRGVHFVDPTGKPERELAEQFQSKAEEVENAGFQRFAVTLRGLADGYDQEAERIIAEHKQEGE